VTAGTAPAGFARRGVAWSLDAALLALATLALCGSRIRAGLAQASQALDALSGAIAGLMADTLLAGGTPVELARAWLSDPAQRAATAALSEAIGHLLWTPLPVFALLSLAWFSGFEASSRQATPGKRLLGLRVVDGQGRRIGLARAMRRHLAGALSWLTLNIGHLLAAVPPRRQSLHDRIAGTQVVQSVEVGPLPAWAHAWVALLLLAAGAALAWLFVAASAAMQRAFDALLLAAN